MAARKLTDRESVDRSSSHLTLLAKNEAGYRNLLALVSKAHVDGFYYKPRIDHDTLEQILRSFSFVGPAMNPARFAAFRERLLAIPGPAVWARTFTLRHGRRPVRTNRQRHDARERARP